tara:strand:- start:1263 stop:2987 length:1725 start_codon:yes stop_codon:yes gene_type:complete
MNFFNIYLEEIKKTITKNKKKIDLIDKTILNKITIESPPGKFNYDLSTNISLILAKSTNQNPKDLAGKIKKILVKEIKHFSSIDIAGPGFLNIKLSNEAWLHIIKNIEKNKKTFGSNKNKNKYNVEFVSANPTGPLHIGHCRGAVFGDVLANLLKFNGNKVIKEFYINDYGKQIDDFSKSIYFRLKEIKHNSKFPEDENLYPGEYIKEISKIIINKHPNINLENYDKIKKNLKKHGLNYSMDVIKSDLKSLGITHDNFFSETNLIKNKAVQKVVNELRKKNLVQEGYLEPPKGEDNKNWKKVKRLIFKSSLFGDVSDRALTKNDNTWTYFANDLAYHSNKVSRKFDYLINILGADHSGYIKRISAAVDALSNTKNVLTCKVCQLVKLIKNGQPYKMSKRKGDFITIKDVLNEVGKDSVRFMMLSRGNDVELDFDFNKVLEKNKDNPVFYVQYCFARINSLYSSLNIKPNHKNKINNLKFTPNEYEYKLLRKIIEWPKIVDLSAKKLEPHRIPFYLYELSTIFHSYWSKGNENPEFKFIIDGKIKNELTFKIFQLISITLINAMFILGVSLPKKM